MKKTTILTMLLVGSTVAFSQISQGSFMLGGSVGFGSNKNKTTSTTSGVSTNTYNNKSNFFNLSPSFGYFVAKGLAVGLSLGINNSTYIYDYPTAMGNSIKENKYENKNTTIGLFARKYFMSNDIFGFYSNLGFGVGPSNSKRTNTEASGTSYVNDRKGNNTNVDLGLGVVYFPSKKIGLHAGFGGLGWSNYTYENTDSSNPNTKSKDENSGFNLNLNSLYLNFGFSMFFGGK